MDGLLSNPLLNGAILSGLSHKSSNLSGNFFSTVLSHSYGLLVPFSVFTLVNLGGALIGILVNRVNPEDKWKLKGKALFVGLALGLIFVGIGIWLGFLQVIRTTNGYSWVDHPYFIDAYAFVAFGITWLFIIAGEIYAYLHR